MDAALLALRANLGARIDAINAARTDFVLASDVRFVTGVENPILLTPTVEVAIPDVDLRDPSVEQERWEGEFNVVVRIWVEDLDPARLVRRNYRYASAVCDVLLQPEIMGPIAVTRVRLRNRVNPETSENEEHLGSMIVVLTGTTDEIRP